MRELFPIEVSTSKQWGKGEAYVRDMGRELDDF